MFLNMHYLFFYDDEKLGLDSIQIEFTKTQAEALYEALGKQLGKSEDSQSNCEKFLKNMEKLTPKNTKPHDTHKWPWVEPSIQPQDFRKWSQPFITYFTKSCDKTTTDLIKTVSNLFEDLATTRNNKNHTK